jgi:hypothetical protein
MAAAARSGAAPDQSAPNKILFVQNLPDATTSQMLGMLFAQFPGYKEVSGRGGCCCWCTWVALHTILLVHMGGPAYRTAGWAMLVCMRTSRAAQPMTSSVRAISTQGCAVAPAAPAPGLCILTQQHHHVFFTSFSCPCRHTPSAAPQVRMVEARPGIAFVEFDNDMQASVAMNGLQNFKITPTNAMAITYAKQ